MYTVFFTEKQKTKTHKHLLRAYYVQSSVPDVLVE